MNYSIIIFDKRVWEKDCSKIPRHILNKLIQRIKTLQEDPMPDGVLVKQLHHYDITDYRFRFGNYRVLFNRYDDLHEIHLLRVLHRSKLY